MQIKRAAVVSLHFSPTHVSHMTAWGKMLRALGFVVDFFLDAKYLPFKELSAIGNVTSGQEYCARPDAPPLDIAVFCNSATQNHSLVKILRARGAKVLYVFHEPEPIWSWQILKSEGWKKTARFLVSSYFSIRTASRSSTVIVASAYGQELYDRGYRRFNGNVRVLPLLFDDEIGSVLLGEMRSRKTSFGFVGTACRSHAFDAFVNFAKFAIRNGSEIPFLIATGIDLTHLLRSDSDFSRMVGEGLIELHHGQMLSNGEINQYYLRCFCIWNAYRRSTQSGVLPRAFMAGTPVLASRTGSFPEYVREGVTGEFIDSDDDAETILAITEKLRRDIDRYTGECRKMFMDKFYWASNHATLSEIIEGCPPHK